MQGQIRTIDDVKSLGTILCVFAHPDDEVFSMGGLIAAAVQNGQKVICMTATRGEAGIQDESRWPARHLGAIRTAELAAAFEILGVEHHYWLDYPDGDCDKADKNQAVQRIVSLIETYRPDSVFSFGPDGMTGHPDHQAVSRWAGLARGKAESPAVLYHAILTSGQYEALHDIDEKFNFFFNIDRPKTCQDHECDIRLELDDELFDRKLRCLRAMPSQYEALLAGFGDVLRPGMGVEAFVKANDSTVVRQARP